MQVKAESCKEVANREHNPEHYSLLWAKAKRKTALWSEKLKCKILLKNAASLRVKRRGTIQLVIRILLKSLQL